MAPGRDRPRPDVRDGSAPGALRQVLFRTRRHVSRWLRRRTRNTSDRSGKPAAAAVKSRACSLEAPRRRRYGLSSRGRSQGPFEFGGQLREGQFAGSRPGDQNDIARGAVGKHVAVEERSNAPPEPISDNRPAHLSAHGHSYARPIATIQNQTGKITRRLPPSAARNSGKIGPAT